mmetsp:Transcript_29828/g.50077  ORF Transcript_29828/g.50077 Transcript_29828/m.50077 type:complete len:169 (+) Transcript_29828:2000-2506(+)
MLLTALPSPAHQAPPAVASSAALEEGSVEEQGHIKCAAHSPSAETCAARPTRSASVAPVCQSDILPRRQHDSHASVLFASAIRESALKDKKKEKNIHFKYFASHFVKFCQILFVSHFVVHLSFLLSSVFRDWKLFVSTMPAIKFGRHRFSYQQTHTHSNCGLSLTDVS